MKFGESRHYTVFDTRLIQWQRFEQQHYTPKEYALVRMMEAAQIELARIEDAK